MNALRVIGLLLLIPTLVEAVDLSGEWQGSDGGNYYLVQEGNRLTWYAERSATSPEWSHVFDGHVHNDGVRGDWVDVPKGRTRGHGQLVLEIRENGNVLEITRKTGGFGGDRLTRAGYVASAAVKPSIVPAPVKPAVAPARPPAAVTRPITLEQAVKEDCIAFNWRTTRREQVDGRWKIVDGSHWMFDFEDNAKEAAAALRIIKHYRMDSSCFVGRPQPSLSYLLSNGAAPSGGMKGEDCVGFNPESVDVVNAGGRWKVVDGSHWLFDFADNEEEARQALAVIKKHQFSSSCFVGRPDPSFTYLRR